MHLFINSLNIDWELLHTLREWQKERKMSVLAVLVGNYSEPLKLISNPSFLVSLSWPPCFQVEKVGSAGPSNWLIFSLKMLLAFIFVRSHKRKSFLCPICYLLALSILPSWYFSAPPAPHHLSQTGFLFPEPNIYKYFNCSLWGCAQISRSIHPFLEYTSL